MGFGGKKEQPTQTTTAMPSKEQQDILNLAMPGVRQFAASVPQRYQGSGIAPFNATQAAAQSAALQAAGLQEPVGQGAADAVNFFTSGAAFSPESNPHLRGAIDAAVRPLTEQYQTGVLPGIRDSAVGAGQEFGGSRRGIVNAAGARDYGRNITDTTSKIVNQNYQTNVDAMLKAVGLAPTAQAALAQPALTTGAVGDVRQAMEQALLGETVSNFNYDQWAPFLQSKELLSLVSGLPGGSTTSTANVPKGNPITGALGGAMSGASLGSMFGPIGTGAGAGIGALLSFL